MKIKPCYDGGTCANEILIEELKDAAGTVIEDIKRALEDERLQLLFDAVDDYLYGQVAGEGYPVGHTNPEHLLALRRAFLRASSNPEGTGEVILRTALRQWQEATDG